MTCDHATTDWKSLIARRDAAAEAGASEVDVSAALDHVDHCDACRRKALMADPSLVFRRLPRVETTAADVESMRQAVASLRRASRVTSVEAEVETAASRRRFAIGHGLRRAAAAVLLAAAGLGAWLAGPTLLEHATLVDAGLDPLATDAAPVAVPSADSLLSAATPTTGLEPLIEPLAVAHRPSAEDLAARPVFEGLSQPRAADVYQVGEEDLLVVMVVDETLDI